MRVVTGGEGTSPGTIARVADLLATLRRAARAIRAGSDPDAVRDTRVAIRRLEAGLATFRDVLPRGRRRQARAALQGLRRRLGPARELEVTLQLLQERLAGEAPDTTVAATAVVVQLGKRVGRRRRDAARACSRKAVERLERQVRRAWRPVVHHPDVIGDGLVAARDRVERRASAATAAIAAGLKSGAEEDLHAARIALKRWRYGEEWLAATGAERGADPAWLRSVQTSLGTLHDVDALCRRLGVFERRIAAANPAAGRPLAPLLKRLRAERRRELERLHELVGPRQAGGPGTTPATRH